MFESFTDAQWVGFSFVLLGMALICGMLLRRLVPWLAAVYMPASVLAGLARRSAPCPSARWARTSRAS